MGITRIGSKTSNSFLQPQIGQTVNIVLDAGIDWFRLGQLVHIAEAGLYTIVAQSGFVYTLELKTAIAIPGTLVNIEMIMPVNDSSSELAWGAKEW